jgi:predicted transcriptional regulator with HTH domain
MVFCYNAALLFNNIFLFTKKYRIMEKYLTELSEQELTAKLKEMKKNIIIFLFSCMMFACNNNSIDIKKASKYDTLHIKGCLETFEIDMRNNRNTINKSYEGGIKHGHWKYYELTVKKTLRGKL